MPPKRQPSEEAVRRVDLLRAAIDSLKILVDDLCPACTDRREAMAELDLALMHATAAVFRNQEQFF